MTITGIHHVSLLVQDTARALDFYCGLLRLQLRDRPPMAYPGAWLALGDLQLHLLELPDPAAAVELPAHVGRDRHLALVVDDFARLERLLAAADIHFTRSQSGRKALFCRDPDGNGLEFIAGNSNRSSGADDW